MSSINIFKKIFEIMNEYENLLDNYANLKNNISIKKNNEQEFDFNNDRFFDFIFKNMKIEKNIPLNMEYNSNNIPNVHNSNDIPNVHNSNDTPNIDNSNNTPNINSSNNEYTNFNNNFHKENNIELNLISLKDNNNDSEKKKYKKDNENIVLKKYYKKMYKKIVLVCHPDKNGDKNTFIKCQKYYEDKSLIGLLYISYKLQIKPELLTDIIIKKIFEEIRTIQEKINNLKNSIIL